MKKKLLTPLVAGAAATALMMTAASLTHAQTIVEGGGNALKDAITAAAEDDVLVINDSLVYDGGFVWNKRITIEAAPGETPTIGETTVVSNSNIYIREGAAGARLGSNDGGQITVQMTPGVFYNMRVSPVGAAGLADTFTVENVRFIDNDGADSTANSLVAFWLAEQAPIDMVFRNVIFDAEDKPGIGIRNWNTHPPGVFDLHFIDCQFINFDNIPVFQIMGGWGDMTLTNCRLETTGLTGRFLYLINNHDNHQTTATNYWTMNFVDSWMVSDGATVGIQLGSSVQFADYTQLNIIRSAMVDETTVNGRNIFVTSLANEASVTISHSDLIRGGDTTDEEAFGYNVMVGADTENVTIDIMDSNLIADIRNLYNAGEASVDASVDYSLLLIRPDDDGDTSGFDLGANNVIGGPAPDFGNAAEGDFTYSNVNQTASSTETPLGSNRDFQAPPATVDTWKLFH